MTPYQGSSVPIPVSQPKYTLSDVKTLLEVSLHVDELSDASTSRSYLRSVIELALKTLKEISA